MLTGLGFDVPDTRSWRLERLRGAHPALDALLGWRKSERLATTYGYGWLDRHVGPDGRLRGAWSGSDGAAGRMTAQAGLHNLPAEMRPAVMAEPGHVLVRADLGQVEPRVLAAVSGDPALAAATADDDLYSPVAAALALRPPDGEGRGARRDVRPDVRYGGPGAAPHGARLSRGAGLPAHPRRGGPRRSRRPDVRRAAGARGLAARRLRRRRRAAGARGGRRHAGRFARNAVVQGAAAELFKMWAVTVRAGLRSGGRIVLCLHDELLLHVRAEHADAVAALLHDALDSSAGRWAAGSGVRFVADVSVVRRWSDAKG